MTNPTNIEEARERRAAELAAEAEELQRIIDEATPEDASDDEGTSKPLPEISPPESVTVDEIITLYGALQLRFEKQAAELQRVLGVAQELRQELEKARNTIATKTVTIQNLARKLRGRSH